MLYDSATIISCFILLINNMNSLELQKKHAKIYETFFTNNSIVVSAPFLINRSGDLHPDFSGVSIKQKLPLRLYI